ncbi:MAG: SDR family oxidoreductase [Dehalococcoidales bacterium]|nr:SDR family oxidoreductase [Candidatus Omnitrophota bacterium]MDD5510421.1 SDR family oxidoreductase [Dehalococcoidales bacterium]
MSNILLTGGSGLIGNALAQKLVEQGHTVYSLSRHPVESSKNLIGLPGDILEPNLGILAVPAEGFDSCYHLAGLVNLGHDKKGDVYETNFIGTRNVINFCVRYDVPHLYYCSTAYCEGGHNPYERSKKAAELILGKSDIPLKTIFRPSIVMPEGTSYDGHFFQLVSLIVGVHHRAEVIRRYIEGQMRLPELRPLFRLPGNPDGVLNLIRVDDVARGMADIKDEGTFQIVNDSPPSLSQIADWVGEVILLDFRIEPEFQATPIEAALRRLGYAFIPYLQGDDFKSDLSNCSKIDKRYIQESIKRFLLKS